MRLVRLAAAAAFALATTAIPVTSATAAELPAPEVAWVGSHVVANGSDAYIQAKYRCYGGETGTHLWASIKQGGEDPTADGSGMKSTAWYDTNYQYANDPAGQTIGCDGHWHVQRFTVKLVDHPFGTDYVSQTLQNGPAWVQFCVFDSSATDDNFPQGFAYSYSWKSVIAQH
ncbi:hypothetical protein [Pedococcus sp. 5OH_020]|uniref:hypothetical protein n=1 Tax=Pedococcus sp. 5OH_020 TaxID=2989814 RepID=UPI0022E9D5AF|nr:hypothetical protein [Pedococcus sp. 5OH_020]